MHVLDQAHGDSYALYNADSAEVLPALPDNSVHLSVFSPPFQSLYTYSPTERDVGNAASAEQFWAHFAFISRELLRATVPGRHVCVHVAQVPLMKAIDGVVGLRDFRGDTTRHFTEAGFVFHGEVCIDKNPQAQAIRTHAKGLLFAQLHKDASWMRPALGDYVLVFRKPGDNPVPVATDVTNDEWIEWAHPVWLGIRDNDTLNGRVARADDDERHICPLQLPVIDRCVRLWSNYGEVVLSPFAGIGSEGYQALRRGRRFVGVELKPEYFRVAKAYLDEAEAMGVQAPAEQPTVAHPRVAKRLGLISAPKAKEYGGWSQQPLIA